MAKKRVDVEMQADKIKAAFGDDESKWRKTYTIKIRGDKLYWLFFLADVGLYAKILFKSLWSKDTRPSEKAASLASWQLDNAEVARQVLEQIGG